MPISISINWAHLVGIADALGDPPFGLLHRLSSFPFSIFAFWIIGQYSTASRNSLATCRLLLFIANLIFSFKAQYTGTLGEVKAIRRLAKCIRQSSGLLFFVFSAVLFLFAKSNVYSVSSCDTPLSKNVKLTKLSLNASSSLTKSQRDAKSSHIVYATLFGLIIAAHSCLFDFEHYSIVKKCAAKDHSAQLVWDRRCTRIFAFWIIGRYSTISRNYSVKRQLLFFIADLIFSFKAQHTGTLGELRPFGDSPNALDDPYAFFSLSFQPLYSFFPSSVNALPQTLNT
ncbi:hypothetical protein H5410_046765 [Solanum commersonii]|uniref:Uncharacterized protein n=1 Tax=Solanum commersonii TaxID=4109 RepID=A0A9J5XD68_SOLCO|nr:hypothetical protein H5410_046765 [Solanum commersonii]